MLVSDLITQAARELGDTSDDFKDNVLLPCLRFVLLELASDESLIAVEHIEQFALTTDQTIDVRQATKSPIYVPTRVTRIVVPAWGATGVLERVPYDRLLTMRQTFAEPATDGQWRYWSFRDPYTIEFWPDLSTDVLYDDDGQPVMAEIWADAPPEAVEATDQIVNLHLEDQPLIVAGLKLKSLQFRDHVPEEFQYCIQLYERLRGRAWARAHGNLDLKQIEPFSF